MKNHSRIIAAASTLALLAGLSAWPAAAQDQAGQDQAAQEQPAQEQPAAAAADAAPAPDSVVATIGDTEITEADLAFAEQDFAEQLAQVPPDRRRSVLIDVLVDMQLLAEAAREEGLDQTEGFERQVEFLRSRALRNAYVEKMIVEGVTDEQLQAEYDRQVAGYEPQQEVRARHILVDTKEQAEEIIDQLDGGADFAELATQSKDGTAQNGGDLGYFSAGQMVEPFQEAAFALEPGAYTEEPVETQFGWHVIKVEDKRMSEPPALSEVEDQLRAVLLQQNYETVLAGLRDQYPVEIMGAEAGPAEDAAPAGEAGSDVEAEPSGDAETEAEAPAEAGQSN